MDIRIRVALVTGATRIGRAIAQHSKPGFELAVFGRNQDLLAEGRVRAVPFR